MSFIGATGLDEVQEQFDILKDEIDANATYINTLVGIPDPLHTPIFGINILNPGLFGLVERAEVNIKALQLGEEGIGTNISGIETTISGIETTISGIEGEVSALQGEVSGIQGEITAIQGEVSGIQGEVSTIQLIELPALATLISGVGGIAGDALSKANKSLGIWDESGDNTYNKKSGNVGIGGTFGEVLINKLEVNGNINIPTGNTYRINNEPFNYSHLAGTPPVSSKWTNATDTITDIYYNTGNVGIGTISNITNKLEIAGNLNISAGSKYKINNVNLAFSDLGGTLSYNSLTDKLTGGTNINIVNNAINNTYTYTLPIATTAVIGGVRPDGSTITINPSTGVISGANTYVLPTASTSVLGGVKIDGTTININNGVISSTAGLPATIRLTPTATDGFYSWVNSQSILAKNPPSGNLYSAGSSAGDTILRSDTDTKLILQSGILDPAITITAGLNEIRMHNRVGINTTPHSTYWLNVNGTINANELRVGGNLLPTSQWTSSGANIYYNSGNVGIGTATNTNNVLLDVNGNIESRTAIGANSSFYFRGVANSDLSRVTIAGQLSTGSAVNDTVLRSTNKLVLQSGTGAGAITISTGNNVGIGTTNPVYKCHIKCIYDNIASGLHLDADDGGGNPNTYALTIYPYVVGGGQVGWKFRTQSNVGGTNTPITINHGGNVGIGLNPSHRLEVNGNIRAGVNCIVQENIFMGTGFNGGGRDFPCNKIDLLDLGRTYGFGVSGNTLDYFAFTTHRFFTGSGGANFGTDRFRITTDGLRFQSQIWHSTLDGLARFYFSDSGITNIRGHGSTPIQFINGVDTPIAWFNTDGELTCMFETQSTTDSDRIIIRGNTGLLARGRYRMLIGHNSFTEFHRCYYEDDEVFNNNMSKEDIDIFKNNYKGRIVISTGKIKTDLTRDIPKEEGVSSPYDEQSERGVRVPTTQNEEEEVEEIVDVEQSEQNEEEEVKVEDITDEEEPTHSSVAGGQNPLPTPTEETKTEWYSLIDKDGITIEDAIPIVQLCKVRKDKRVFGVLGSPTRSTNNKARLIVNSVGEGAICVCNSNGNIENGDYIQSSDILGYGEKQDDDILHNYSVAKAVMDCTFELDSPYYQCYELASGVRVALIACTYHCG